MQFLNYNTGYAMNGNSILKTVNHGVNWNLVTFTPPVNEFSYKKIRVISENTICFEGSYTTFWIPYEPAPTLHDVLYVTTNDGNTWQKTLDLPSYTQGNINLNVSLTDFVFTDASIGYNLNLYVSNGDPTTRISKSTNSGINWTDIFHINHVWGKGLFFLNNNTGWITTYNSSGISQGNGMYKTTDGGTSWNFISTHNPDKFIFTNENYGYSPGYNTTDGGNNWVYQFTPSNCNKIKFANNFTGYIIGDNGLVYKTTNGGGLTIGVNQISYSSPANFKLLQNYPNPFNPSTVIRYQLSVAEFTTLKVFDLLGKEVTTLVEENQNAGNYAVDFNSAEYNLPSGIYFYTLNAGEFKETRKMILIK